MDEYKLIQAEYGSRQWDHSFHIRKNETEKYTCDNHNEFITTISSLPYYSTFGWHNIYKRAPQEIIEKVGSFFSKPLKTIKESEERFGVGVDFYKSEIEVGVHAQNNLGFIERVHDVVRNELHLERPKRIDDDSYRRKMLNATVFIARHFDDKGDKYYSTISNFLSLLGFDVLQGEEYISDSIPEKVKHKIDQQDAVTVNVSGDRDHSWLISESSYALGKNKHIILLVESATKIDNGILGKDLEYITYPENEIEKTFCSLLQEFRSIGVKGIFF
jgi:hypothetical protein